MKLLLDTHILLWTLADDPRLSRQAREMIDHPESEIIYSAVSPWETEIKHALHPDQMSISGSDLITYCQEAGFISLPVANRHVIMLSTLSRREESAPHRDPFDRIMICQAKADGLIFLTHDHLLPDYQEPCIVYV